MPRGPLWTPQEEDLLRKGMAEDKKPEDICLEFHKLHRFSSQINPRSPDAIRSHIKSMKKKGKTKPATNSRKKWEPKDDHRLLELFRDTDLEEEDIGQHLGRSEDAVRTRIRILGIGHLREPEEKGIISRILTFIRGGAKRAGQ